MSHEDITKDVVEEGEIVAPVEDQGQEDHNEENEEHRPLWAFEFPEGPITLEGVNALIEAISADPYDDEAGRSLLSEAKNRFILGIAEGVYTLETILQLSLKFKNAGLC